MTSRLHLLLLFLFALFFCDQLAMPLCAQLAPSRMTQVNQIDYSIGLSIADRDELVKLSRAKEFLKSRQRNVAISLLNEILQSEEESAFPVDKDRTMLRNLRLEAEQILGSLPPDTKQNYDTFFNADAQQMLNEGIEQFDLEKLAEVSRRFYYTTAGYEATHLVAMSHLDQGRPFDAAAWFQRLRNRRALPKDSRATMALQAAMAWSLSGDWDRANLCLMDLKRLAGSETISVGDRDVRVFSDDEDALSWLHNTVMKHVPENKAEQPKPLNLELLKGVHSWSVNTSTWKVPIEEAPFSGGVVDVSRQVRGIKQDFVKKKRAAILSTRPEVAGDVALVRTQSNLVAYDLLSGEMVWKTQQPNVLEQVRRGTIPPLPGDSGSILDPMLRDRLFQNPTYGRLATKNGLVFCIEDLGFVTSSPNPYSRTASNHALGVKSFNRLCAYSVRTGKLVWNVGGKAEDAGSKLPNYFFLGAPMPLAGQLYCLAEVERKIQLVVLDAATGGVRWTKAIQSVAYSVEADEFRGRAGLSPAYAEGTVVCPTGAGLVAAIDLATRQILWSYRYRELDEGSPQDRARQMMIARMLAARGEAPPKVEKNGNWHDSVPLIGDGRVYVTPMEGNDLLCLRLLDGALEWKVPKKNREYIAGTQNGNAVVVAADHVELLDHRDGSQIWECPLKTHPPSGVGVLENEQLVLPLSDRSVAIIDLKTGKRESTIEYSIAETSPGNLAFSGGHLISQDALGIHCFQLETEQNNTTDQGSQK